MENLDKEYVYLHIGTMAHSVHCESMVSGVTIIHCQDTPFFRSSRKLIIWHLYTCFDVRTSLIV